MLLTRGMPTTASALLNCSGTSPCAHVSGCRGRGVGGRVITYNTHTHPKRPHDAPQPHCNHAEAAHDYRRRRRALQRYSQRTKAHGRHPHTRPHAHSMPASAVAPARAHAHANHCSGVHHRSQQAGTVGRDGWQGLEAEGHPVHLQEKRGRCVVLLLLLLLLLLPPRHSARCPTETS